jgi:DNA end-binding protein Ku
MRPIWKGAISFGLVNIPIGLYSATKREDLSFKLLRESDHSPVNYKRVAEVDGKEVGWDQIVKGYEYEKGKFVVLKDEDFRRVDVEATQTIDIMDFVELGEINPMVFHKPYYIEPQKGGDKAYALLRETLNRTGKVGIARVVIRSREHIATVRPCGDFLVLDLLYFDDEIQETTGLRSPDSVSLSKQELTMAERLVADMTAKWEPEKYTDQYRSALEGLIEEKIAAGGAELPAPKGAPKRKMSPVIDLVAVLQQSLEKKDGGKATAKRPAKSAPARKSARQAGSNGRDKRKRKVG